MEDEIIRINIHDSIGNGSDLCYFQYSGLFKKLVSMDYFISKRNLENYRLAVEENNRHI